MFILPRRATLRRVEGGAGSKRCAWMRPRNATRSAPIPRDSRTPPRSHPRKRGPCSTLRCAADSGCNPSGWHEFWPVAPGSRRKDSVFGAETGAVRRIAITGATSPFPQTGLRLTSHGAALSKGPLLRLTKPQDFLLALSQNRDSASRGSWCYGLLLRRKKPAGARARRSFADEAHGC